MSKNSDKDFEKQPEPPPLPLNKLQVDALVAKIMEDLRKTGLFNFSDQVNQKLETKQTEVSKEYDLSHVYPQTEFIFSNVCDTLTSFEPEKPSSFVSESQVDEENAPADEQSSIEISSNPQEQTSSPQDDVTGPNITPPSLISHQQESENCFPQTSKQPARGKYLESKQRMKPDLLSLGAEHTILRSTLCKEWDYTEPTWNHSTVKSCPENSFDVGAFKVAYLSNQEELGNEAGCSEKLTQQSCFEKWFHHNDIQDLKVMDFTIWLIQDLRRMDPAVFKGAYLINQGEYRCKLNSYGFSTHQEIFTNWNHQSIFSEQRDIEFTTWANQICRRTDISSLRRELRPNQEASGYNSKCFGFLSHKGTMSKLKHLKRSWDELVMNFQSQQTFSLTGFQISEFETLQSYIWRPGEFSKLFFYMFKDFLSFKYTDMSRLPLSKASNAGDEKGVRRTRRLYTREEDGRFKPPDLDQDKHRDINRFMLEKEEPPDSNLTPEPNDEDLRANLLKGGGDDAIWTRHQAKMELIGFIYEVLDREKQMGSRQIMMGFSIMKKSDLDKFWSTRRKAHQAKPKYSRIIYQSDGNSKSYNHAKGLVEMFIKSTYIFTFF